MTKNFAINIVNEKRAIIGALDLFGNEDIKLTYQYSDIKKPETRKVNSTNEFTIPGTKNNNKLLMPFFTNGYSVTNFNPNFKLDAQLSNGNVLFNGSLQLTKVTIDENNRYEYTVIIYNKIMDFFNELGENELRGTVDLSEYNHILDSETIENSWYNKIYRNANLLQMSNGFGYVYPLEDRVTGVMINNINEPFFPTDKFRPAVYVKEYVDKIFKKYGWKYKSDFFNSDYFKKMIIPFGSDKFIPADEDTEFGDQLIIGKDKTGFFAKHNTTETIPLFKLNKSNNAIELGSNSTKLNFNTIIAGNSGNVYSTALSRFTVNKSGLYNITTGERFRLKLTYNAGLPASGKWYVRFTYKDNNKNEPIQFPYIKLQLWNTTKNKMVAENKAEFAVSEEFHYGSTTELFYDLDVKLTASNLNLFIDDIYEVRCIGVVTPGRRGQNSPWKKLQNIFWETVNIPSGTNGTAEIFIYKSTSETQTFFNAEYTSQEVGYKDVVPMNNAIPDNFKLKDFFTSLNNTFNLYWEPTDNYKELLIEPYESFYEKNDSINPIQDLTKKVIRENQLTIEPMYELTGNKYLFTYKEDGDWANTKYKLERNEIFGQKLISINNDFLTEEVKIEPIFSATPLVTFDYKGDNGTYSGNKFLYMSSYAKKDDKGIKTPINPKPRLLFWGGLIDAPQWSMGMIVDFSKTVLTPIDKLTLTKQPYAGHLDNPYRPTEDLNFGVAKEFYQEWTTVTNNNLFNKYWRNWLNRVIDIDSHMLTCDVYFNELDIANFNLKNSYTVDNVIYKVNKMEYDIANSIAKFELIRAIDYPKFKPAIGYFTNTGMQRTTINSTINVSPWGGGGLTDPITNWTDGTEIVPVSVGNFPNPNTPYYDTETVNNNINNTNNTWNGNEFGTWSVGYDDGSVIYTGTPYLEPQIFTSQFPVQTGDYLPVFSKRIDFRGSASYKQIDLINSNGFYNQISDSIAGPVSINGNYNTVFSDVSTISINGNNNTVLAGVTNTVVIGDDNLVSESDATYINGTVTKNGMTAKRIDMLSGGNIDDNTTNYFDINNVNIISGGIDNVKSFNGITPYEIVNGSIDISNKLKDFVRIL